MNGRTTDEPASGVVSRATTLLLTAAVGVAAIGYVVGIDYGVPKPDPVPPARTALDVDADNGALLPAMSYEEIGRTPVGSTRADRSSLADLRRPARDLFAEFTPDPADKRRSLGTRSQRRAFNGAPPVVPHGVDQLSSAACLACHGEGFEIQNRTARQLPHPYLASCLQCHVAVESGPFAPATFARNDFSGVAAPFEGERAWPGAPPTIPHTTWMRDNCLACHGPSGWPGMRSTHPWQQSCLQCHAPSAALDHAITGTGDRFLPPPKVAAP